MKTDFLTPKAILCLYPFHPMPCFSSLQLPTGGEVCKSCGPQDLSLLGSRPEIWHFLPFHQSPLRLCGPFYFIQWIKPETWQFSLLPSSLCLHPTDYRILLALGISIPSSPDQPPFLSLGQHHLCCLQKPSQWWQTLTPLVHSPHWARMSFLHHHPCYNLSAGPPCP